MHSSRAAADHWRKGRGVWLLVIPTSPYHRYHTHTHTHTPTLSLSPVWLRFGSFHGQDEQCLQRRFASCKRTPSYTKMLPKHQYEVDMPPQQDTISVSQGAAAFSLWKTVVEGARAGPCMATACAEGVWE